MTYLGCYAPPLPFTLQHTTIFMSVGWCYSRALAAARTTTTPSADGIANLLVPGLVGEGVKGGDLAVYFGLKNGSLCYSGFGMPPLEARVEEEWCDVNCAGYAWDMCECVLFCLWWEGEQNGGEVLVSLLTIRGVGGGMGYYSVYETADRVEEVESHGDQGETRGSQPEAIGGVTHASVEFGRSA
jgi:hypothetical protein